MKRPKQLPAVDRNSQKAAAVPVGAKVGPSGWFENFLEVVKTVGPAVGSAIASA